MPEDPRPFPMIAVESEWARLHEVIVGRPHYRIVRPFPESVRARIGEEAWRAIKRGEGRLLSEVFPDRHRRAAEQMAAARAVLEDRGVRVHEVPQFEEAEEPCDAEGPNGSMQCFPRDPLLVVGGEVIELALANARRRPEVLPLRRLLAGLAGGRPSASAPPGIGRVAGAAAVIEGGDCLVNGTEVLVGVSGQASNPAGVEWLQRRLGSRYSITPVPLTPAFAHLDLALALVRPGLGICCPEAFPEGLPRSLARWDWVEVSARQALGWLAGNVLPLSAQATMVPAEADGVTAALARRGQEVVTVPFRHVSWMGGGLRCWTQPLVRTG